TVTGHNPYWRPVLAHRNVIASSSAAAWTGSGRSAQLGHTPSAAGSMSQSQGAGIGPHLLSPRVRHRPGGSFPLPGLCPSGLARQTLATTLGLRWRQLGPNRKVVGVGRDRREQRGRVPVHVPNHVVRPDTPWGSLAGPACHGERDQLVGDGDVIRQRTLHHPGQEVVPVVREWFTFRRTLLLGIAHPQLQRKVRRSVVLLGDREADDVSLVILVGPKPGQDGEQLGVHLLELDRYVVPVQDGAGTLVHNRSASGV